MSEVFKYKPSEGEILDAESRMSNEDQALSVERQDNIVYKRIDEAAQSMWSQCRDQIRQGLPRELAQKVEEIAKGSLSEALKEIISRQLALEGIRRQIDTIENPEEQWIQGEAYCSVASASSHALEDWRSANADIYYTPSDLIPDRNTGEMPAKQMKQRAKEQRANTWERIKPLLESFSG